MRTFGFYRHKKVLVTGGSSGIGKEAAKMLAASGASVAIVARGKDRLEAALGEIRAGVVDKERQVCSSHAVDVSDAEAVETMTTEVLETLGGLDVLINNAGVAHPAALGETPLDVFDRMMGINYFGTVYPTRALMPHFVTQRRGHICNVASLLGFMGIYGYTAYAASKFAIAGFSDCLRQELLEHGVGISVLFPPDTDTPQLAAENEIKPPQTRAIAGNVKVMSPGAVAESMLQGIARGRYHILPGFESKMTYFMYRHFPGVVRWVIDGSLRKYQRTQL